MDSLHLAPTASSLEVSLDAVTGTLELAGSSYPEDAYAFFLPIREWLSEFLATTALPVHLLLCLDYLNTSSTKAVLDLLDILEEAHRVGRDVHVVWHHAADDEDMRDMGEDFRDGLEMPVELVADPVPEG